jgi:hypothetical protein
MGLPERRFIDVLRRNSRNCRFENYLPYCSCLVCPDSRESHTPRPHPVTIAAPNYRKPINFHESGGCRLQIAARRGALGGIGGRLAWGSRRRQCCTAGRVRGGGRLRLDDGAGAGARRSGVRGRSHTGTQLHGRRRGGRVCDLPAGHTRLRIALEGPASIFTVFTPLQRPFPSCH